MGKRRILFYLDDYPADAWRDAFIAADPTLDFRAYPDWGKPEDFTAAEQTYAFVWQPKPGLLKSYPNITAIFSLGAGIDHLTQDPDLPTHIPIIRMGDDGLKEGMQEFMVMATLMLHRGILPVIAASKDAVWERIFAVPAKEKTVGIMGYGALGKAVAAQLRPFGYKMTSWSNSTKPAEDGIVHYHGPDQLDTFLATTDIFICLLPNTPQTTDLLNAATFAKMPEGAAIINGGRGSLINDDDLISALDSDHISGAVLDVFKTEPLPAGHPYWCHDKVLVTPHIAAVTRVQSAVEFVLQNIDRLEKGQTAENLLDLKRGY